MNRQEFLSQASLDAGTLDAWLSAGWLAPQVTVQGRRFSLLDLARTRLILDLQEIGLNDDAISVVLDLVDQVYGLRRILRDLLGGIAQEPQATHDRIVAGLHLSLTTAPSETPMEIRPRQRRGQPAAARQQRRSS
jgi:chaperone modulatory protein CbpM